MVAERQKLLELNAQRQAEAAAREQTRLAQNKESRQWQATLRRRRRPCSTARCTKQGRRGGYGCRRQERGRTTTRPVAHSNRRSVD
jgi:hypothetical protein